MRGREIRDISYVHALRQGFFSRRAHGPKLHTLRQGTLPGRFRKHQLYGLLPSWQLSQRHGRHVVFAMPAVRRREIFKCQDERDLRALPQRKIRGRRGQHSVQAVRAWHLWRRDGVDCGLAVPGLFCGKVFHRLGN